MRDKENDPSRSMCTCQSFECFDCAGNIYTGIDFPYEGGNGFIIILAKRVSSIMKRTGKAVFLST